MHSFEFFFLPLCTVTASHKYLKHLNCSQFVNFKRNKHTYWDQVAGGGGTHSTGKIPRDVNVRMYANRRGRGENAVRTAMLCIRHAQSSYFGFVKWAKVKWDSTRNTVFCFGQEWGWKKSSIRSRVWVVRLWILKCLNQVRSEVVKFLRKYVWMSRQPFRSRLQNWRRRNSLALHLKERMKKLWIRLLVCLSMIWFH